MNVVDHISKTYFDGNVSAFAAWLDEDPRVITNWRRRKSIPSARMVEILSRSDDTGLGLTPSDFFPDRKTVALEAAE